jgi:hypothetical protein
MHLLLAQQVAAPRRQLIEQSRLQRRSCSLRLGLQSRGVCCRRLVRRLLSVQRCSTRQQLVALSAQVWGARRHSRAADGRAAAATHLHAAALAPLALLQLTLLHANARLCWLPGAWPQQHVLAVLQHLLQDVGICWLPCLGAELVWVAGPTHGP